LKSLGKEGKHVHERLSKRAKVVATFVAMLLAATFLASLLPEVTATPSPVEIVSIDPVSGPVGETVRVIGGIDITNGSYQIFFDGKEVKNGNATETEVNTTFTVPLSAKGNHSVTLVDVASGNQSLPVNFNVITSYYVNVKPTRIQEGLNTTITVGVNDAEANTTLTFTINITDPQPAIYTATLNVSTNATGSGSNSILYYGDFSADANTNYVGTYDISVVGVNEILATGNFTVGLTDRPDYGRTKTEVVSVHIRGAGYKPTWVVIVNVTFAGNPVGDFPIQIAANEDGVVTSNWTTPSNATLGIYTVTLTNATGMQVKPVPDVQNFTLTEVVVYCQTQNRYDKEPLAGVSVGAYLGETYVTSGITNETGWVDLRVSHGYYTFKAFWKTVEVGSLDYNVLENATLPPLECELAHITIMIKNETGFPLPLINVTLISNKTGVLQFETNNTGTIRINTFTNVSYTIETRRYDNLFNTTQIANLTVTRWIKITCPTLTLFVNVLDSKGIPLKNVEVAVYEWSSGVAEPVQSEITDDLGSAVFYFTFGRYKIWVYSEDHTIVLNKTVVDLTEDQMFFVVHCKIFNMDLSVIVKDYFGHPISNALVEVEREGVSISSQKTGSNGIASFLNITGGDCQISVSVMGTVSETRTLYLDETKVVVFKLEKFVVVGGYLLEVTQLIAYISLGIVIVLFALALIYRRLRLRKIPEEEKEKSL
jgi:hypothetical protein